MKNLILLLLFTFLYPFVSSGQTSITSAHMPQANDTLRYSIATPDSSVLLNFGRTGANQVWRFDSLQPIRQGVSEFVTAAQSGYNAVPSSRIGELLADTIILGGVTLLDVFNFYDNSTSEYALDYRGFSTPTGFSPPFPTVIREAPAFSDKDEIYQFPLDYLDRDSSTFNFTYQNIILGVYLSSSGYRINEVEAWGTVTTPFGTFNCIKVKTDIVTYDSVSFGMTNFGTNSHQRQYKWLSTQIPIPVATLSGNVVAGAFLPTNVQYRDSLRQGVPGLFAPLTLFNADTTVVNVNGSVLFTNNTISITPPSYEWTISPNTHTYINGSNRNSAEPEVQFTAPGFYDVQLVSRSSRGADTLSINAYIEVRLPTGIRDLSLEEGFSIYPNPVPQGEVLNVNSEQPLRMVQLFDQQSRLVKRWDNMNSTSIRINTEQLAPGLYILHIEGFKSTFNGKIVIH